MLSSSDDLRQERSAAHLVTPAVRLSKSRIAAFEHCPRRLWLQVHRRDLARYDERTLHLFKLGHWVGELARARYEHGILVKEDHRQLVAAFVRTNHLIEAPTQSPIFEAAFQREGVVIRADILEPDGWGGWRLIEVKNSASVKPYQLLDVATQAWVLRGSQVCVSSVIIRHLERPLRKISEFRPWIRFVDADVTSDVQQLTSGRQQVVEQARWTSAGPEPQVQPGPHCVRPFRCEFRDHCGRVGPE